MLNGDFVKTSKHGWWGLSLHIFCINHTNSYVILGDLATISTSLYWNGKFHIYIHITAFGNLKPSSIKTVHQHFSTSTLSCRLSLIFLGITMRIKLKCMGEVESVSIHLVQRIERG